ncbi:hypothetical protein HYALB_00009837 [Hymenoscyphus albidus]|uniref:Uncharacterized protein n=1 Tax=Hymenoscyphus albidus TaxID=595503 RepID=A0A9N9M3X7_9HELO|nr:hypothetical protein HYALB_00009837 [Hymenoscyphus albidus]
MSTNTDFAYGTTAIIDFGLPPSYQSYEDQPAHYATTATSTSLTPEEPVNTSDDNKTVDYIIAETVPPPMTELDNDLDTSTDNEESNEKVPEEQNTIYTSITKLLPKHLNPQHLTKIFHHFIHRKDQARLNELNVMVLPHCSQDLTEGLGRQDQIAAEIQRYESKITNRNALRLVREHGRKIMALVRELGEEEEVVRCVLAVALVGCGVLVGGLLVS